MEEVETGEHAIRVDADRCIGCWECIDVCPQTGNTEYPVYAKGEGVPAVVNPDSCIGCLSCEFSCRADALIVSGKRREEPFVDRRAEIKCRAMF